MVPSDSVCFTCLNVLCVLCVNTVNPHDRITARAPPPAPDPARAAESQTPGLPGVPPRGGSRDIKRG